MVAEAKAKVQDAASPNPKVSVCLLIHDYQTSVHHILSNNNLAEDEIFKILYYNISSVSSGVIPVEWAREELAINHF
ncbi:MAG: hypothetical protein IPK68_22745 [Bdellovibrionales bacterium]|nr:hypothetical protein [Bdellovibrionales bacterium]